MQHGFRLWVKLAGLAAILTSKVQLDRKLEQLHHVAFALRWLCHPQEAIIGLRLYAVGFAPLPEKLEGSWTFPGYPEQIQLLGRSFSRSRRWAFPYAGVVAQYREDVDHHSMHVMVFGDGHYEIDHIDDANPERGLVLEHALKDVSNTTGGAVVILAGGALLVAGLSWALTR